MNSDGWGFLGAGTSDQRLSGMDLQHNVQNRVASKFDGFSRIKTQPRESGGPMKHHELEMHDGHHKHHEHHMHHGHHHSEHGHHHMHHHLEEEKMRHEHAMDHHHHHLERHHSRHYNTQHGHDHYKGE